VSITITTASTDQHLRKILELQKINLPKALTEEEIKQEGFVTVDHDFATLKDMNNPYPHTIALGGNEVVGYALVMLPSMRNDIEILKPMFEKIDGINYKSKELSESKYIMMGQACVAKGYRGQGVFYRMYDHLKTTTQHDFDFMINEVSANNPRSLKAHNNHGFQNILSYNAPDGHPWEILLWDFSQ